MQKADSITSAGATADSEQKDEVSTSCQHSIKPHVVGSQSTPALNESVLPKRKYEPETPPESFTAQSWLFREFMDKMQKNNVRSLLVYSEDSDGSPQLFEWCMPKNKEKLLELISS
jgi:hypothetical protein